MHLFKQHSSNSEQGDTAMSHISYNIILRLSLFYLVNLSPVIYELEKTHGKLSLEKLMTE